MKHLNHKIAAVLTTGFFLSNATASMAAGATTNFSSVADNITGSAKNLPNLISTVAYIGGIGMGVAGIFKLKQHVDNPSQHAMKDGLVRLGAGGGLLTLPYVTDAMMGTISDGTSTGPKVETFDLSFGNGN